MSRHCVCGWLVGFALFSYFYSSILKVSFSLAAFKIWSLSLVLNRFFCDGP